MGAQNLVSGNVSEEQKTTVAQGIQTIRGGIPVLVVLQPEQKKDFVRVGNTFGPFIEMAHEATGEHPEIMPAIFNIAEFDKDYQLQKDLVPILSQLHELTESVEDTIFAARSDAMSAALEVYAAVQQNKNKVPGLDTLASNMAAFFKKSGRKVLSTEAQEAK